MTVASVLSHLVVRLRLFYKINEKKMKKKINSDLAIVASQIPERQFMTLPRIRKLLQTIYPQLRRCDNSTHHPDLKKCHVELVQELPASIRHTETDVYKCPSTYPLGPRITTNCRDGCLRLCDSSHNFYADPRGYPPHSVPLADAQSC